MIVELEWAEVLQAAHVGCMRNVRALSRGARHRYEDMGSAWAQNIEGAAAEMAVAKALDIYWSDAPRPDHGAGDVGPYEVRSTRNRGLLIYQDDPVERVFVLVAGCAPRLEIVGWLVAHEAQQRHYWNDVDLRVPCFEVPREHLHDFDDLRRAQDVA